MRWSTSMGWNKFGHACMHKAVCAFLPSSFRRGCGPDSSRVFHSLSMHLLLLIEFLDDDEPVEKFQLAV
jgi:hypothetical protein